MKKKVCVSFDYSEDAKYRNLLKAWNENPNFDFNISDKTPDEINTDDYARVKAVLTSRIKEADCLLVVVGKKTDTRHPRSYEIGEKNWQIWEMKKAKDLGKKLVAVKIDSSYTSPDELQNSGASWAMSFTLEEIIKKLKNL